MKTFLNLVTRDWARFTVLLMLFVPVTANADQCPGSNTCPSSQTAIVQGPNAVEVKWIEPDLLPIEYYVTSKPSAPNQPVQFQVVDPADWQDRMIYGLKPSTAYVFTICGWYSASNQSCVTTTSVTTLVPSAGGGGSTPAPTITQSSATTTSITISWNGGRSYDFYQVYQIESAYAGIGLPNQAQTGSGASGSWTFNGFQPGTRYQVAVQGCLNSGWTSDCSQWAAENITTAPPPPPPALAPQNLHTMSSSWTEIAVLWREPPGVEASDTSRTPDWQPSANVKHVNGGLQDLAVVAGQTYTYEVCLRYQSGRACASTTGRPQAPPPAPAPEGLFAPTAINAEWFPSSEVSVVWNPAARSRTTAFLVQHRVGVAPLSDVGASPWKTVATLDKSAWSYNGTYPHLTGPMLQIFRVCASDGTNYGTNTACTTPIAVIKSSPLSGFKGTGNLGR
jgi:hypothetical protein